MKKNLLLVSIICLSTTLFAQKLTYIGEMRYMNGKPVLYKHFEYEFTYQDRSDSIVNVIISPKEKYYTENQGTEIVFYVDEDFVSKNKYNTLFLKGIFYITLTNKQKKIKAEMKNIPLDFSVAKPINANTFKLQQPLTIAEPELFSLVMMLNHIVDQLDNISSRKGGFSNIVDNLDNFLDSYSNDKKLSYLTLIDFYKLLVFLEDYVPENSFFNDEAKKLNARIVSLNSQVSETTNLPIPSFANNRDLIEELVNSNEVYSEYQKVLTRITDYYSRLKLILFFKSTVGSN